MPRAHADDDVGMFFFDDNVYALRKGNPFGERLAQQEGMLLMM